MRWIVAVVGLVAGAWFLSDRQRRARVQEKLRGAIPMDGTAPGDDTASTPSEMLATARAKVAEVQATWPRTASHVVDLATSAGSAAVQKAHELGTAARQSTGDAVDHVQGAAGAAIDRAQHAMQTATGQAQEARSATPVLAAWVIRVSSCSHNVSDALLSATMVALFRPHDDLIYRQSSMCNYAPWSVAMRALG